MDTGSTTSNLSTATSSLRKLWEDEQRYPRWFKDASETWDADWESFEKRCKESYAVHEIDGTFVFTEHSGEIHFGSIRGTRPNIEKLLEIQTELLKHFPYLFGWINVRNRGMRRIAEQLGFRFYGVRMFHGTVKGKVGEWLCYTVK